MQVMTVKKYQQTLQTKKTIFDFHSEQIVNSQNLSSRNIKHEWQTKYEKIKLTMKTKLPLTTTLSISNMR